MTSFTNSSFYNLKIENELKCYLKKLFIDRLMNTAGHGAVYSACGAAVTSVCQFMLTE